MGNFKVQDARVHSAGLVTPIPCSFPTQHPPFLKFFAPPQKAMFQGKEYYLAEVKWEIFNSFLPHLKNSAF